MAAEKTVKEMINDFFKNIGGDTNELAKELRKLDSKYMYRDGKTRTKLKAQARANIKNNKESNEGSKKNKVVKKKKVAQNSTDGFPRSKKVAQNSTDGFPRPKKVAQNSDDGFGKKNKVVKKKKVAQNSDDGFGKKKKVAQNSTDGFPRPKNIKIPKGSTLSGLAKKYGTTVKNLMSLNPQIKNADKIYAGKDLNVGANTKVEKPTSVKKPKNINSPTSKEKDAGAGKFTGGGRTKAEINAGAGKFTGKSTKKAAPKKESFLGFEKISGPKGMFIAPAGVRKMKTPFGGTIEVDSTPLKDREDRKAGGKVSKKVGGKVVKRSMGGPAKPKKKTVFRRGGGKALRGFGKATYSNKMY